MKRTVYTSKELDKYIEKQKENGKSPSAVINEIYQVYQEQFKNKNK